MLEALANTFAEAAAAALETIIHAAVAANFAAVEAVYELVAADEPEMDFGMFGTYSAPRAPAIKLSKEERESIRWRYAS